MKSRVVHNRLVTPSPHAAYRTAEKPQLSCLHLLKTQSARHKTHGIPLRFFPAPTKTLSHRCRRYLHRPKCVRNLVRLDSNKSKSVLLLHLSSDTPRRSGPDQLGVFHLTVKVLSTLLHCLAFQSRFVVHLHADVGKLGRSQPAFSPSSCVKPAPANSRVDALRLSLNPPCMPFAPVRRFTVEEYHRLAEGSRRDKWRLPFRSDAALLRIFTYAHSMFSAAD